MQRTITLVIASVAVSLAMSLLVTALVRFAPEIRARIQEPFEEEVAS